LSQPKDQSEPAFLYLTTTGRHSGQAREIEIWFAGHGERYYLIAEHREQANWVRNILHDPRVLFRVRDDVSAGTGRVVDTEREAELWAEVRALFDKKYGWSDGLIVELSRTQGPI
jgi:deazaflavin-dependent oxidoreductase (nitroreductase family)